MIVTGAEWKPEDPASIGDVAKDEIAQKISSWISQSTEGQILETDLP
jgi:hypothetical protein